MSQETVIWIVIGLFMDADNQHTPQRRVLAATSNYIVADLLRDTLAKDWRFILFHSFQITESSKSAYAHEYKLPYSVSTIYNEVLAFIQVVQSCLLKQPVADKIALGKRATAHNPDIDPIQASFSNYEKVACSQVGLFFPYSALAEGDYVRLLNNRHIDVRQVVDDAVYIKYPNKVETFIELWREMGTDTRIEFSEPA